MICKTNQKQVDKAENPSLSGIFPSFFPDSSVLPDWPEEFGSAMNAFSLGLSGEDMTSLIRICRIR
jgi:hypothetical protein